MRFKTENIRKAIDKVNQQKVVLYHVISPIDEQKLNSIEKNGCFDISKNALGGQSDGYYFFTTRQAAEYHIDTNKDVWVYGGGKNAYLVECETDLNSVKYPDWQLDYEATQDFLFDIIHDFARERSIVFDDVKIEAPDKNKLNILVNGTFFRITNFNADKHSGLIEKTVDFLYNHNEKFKHTYDNLLKNIMTGNISDKELCAVKTVFKQKITKITKIEQNDVQKTPDNSQIEKFLARYGRNRNM